MKKKIVLGSIFLAVLAGLLYWWGSSRAAQDPAQRYRTVAVERGSVVQSVSANGTLNPVVLVSVGTQVSGTVKKLYVDFNDQVKAGQPLLELDDALVAASERQSAANVINAQASLDLAQANETRMRALLAQEYVSRQEYDQAAQALKSARAQLAQAQAANARDRANLGYTTIRSPVDGVVIDRVVDLGQTVAASFQTPTLIKIAQDLTEMRIDTSFAEADLGNIREGLPARFTVDAFPDRQFEGVVQQIRLNPTTQQNVVTYNVRISVANPEHILLPGMTAYVTIGVQSRDDVLLVPNAALRFKPAEAVVDKASGGDKAAEKMPAAEAGGGKGKKRAGQGATIHVLAEGKLQPVNVRLGITDGRNTEVLGGEPTSLLQPGARVVVGENASGGKAPSSVGMRMF
ncbi:MAG: efflux RND transporter periplasmic adaptor subunit [Azonexus sp.]|jgi:HlyD family secretion protein|nr:efflux RND transporter periplasmic adaptor subunit [Azonexus sp.]